MRTLSNRIWLVLFILLFAGRPIFAQSDSILSGAVQTFIVELIMMAIAITVPALVVMLIQWLRKQITLIESRLTSEQLYILRTITETVVKAAEKSAIIGAIQNTATVKKQFAVNAIQNALREHGLNDIADNLEEISNSIEAAIQDGIHKSEPPMPAQARFIPA